MKVSTPAGLDAFLAANSDYAIFDLYDFVLQTDTLHLRYTTFDTDVLFQGNIYTSKGPAFDKIESQSRGHWKAGVDPDSWQVAVMPAATDPITGAASPATIRGQPWLAALRAGALVGATCHVHRCYRASSAGFVTPVAPDYTLVDYFLGRVAAVDLGRTQATITLNSHIEQLARPMPGKLYGPFCRHTLFDAGCTLDRNAFAVTGLVQDLVADNANFRTNLPQALDYFSLGYVAWNTGNNRGLVCTIRRFYGAGPGFGTIQLIKPMPFPVLIGDAFGAFPGCDKSLDTCTNKFGNRPNFGGQPSIPSPEAAL